MVIELAEMTAADYDACLTLWRGMEGIGLSDADSRDGIGAFLSRNPGLSVVARLGGEVVGAVLCGHDGRRGYLHHLAVAPPARGRGIARAMVERCLAGLAVAGILKCHIFVHHENHSGERFWRRLGWRERTDLKLMSQETRRSSG